jgi:glutaredoxin-like protein
MPLISEQDAEHLRNEFESQLVDPVKLVVFTQTVECQFCAETRQIAEEVAALSEKVSVEVYNFVTDKATADLYGVDKIPAIAVLREEDGEEADYGIRFYGIPSGYEFSSIIEDIIDVSKGDSGLQPKTREALAGITEPVHFQVFVTPTCPYCPQAVRLAHKFAMESEHIRADMVEAIEFPHLSNKYGVYGVPRTVINESVHQEGAVPEPLLLAKLQEAMGRTPVPEHHHHHLSDPHD